MKVLVTAALAAVSLLALGSAHATDVGVSVQISEPGVYGRVDIGRFPQPAVMVAQPVIVQQPAYVVAQPQPVYLWVPPGHQKKWRNYCGRYNACGVPVYFVQDRWYRDHVLPHRGERYERHDRDDRGGRGDWRDERGGGGRDWDDHPGHGNGHGHGHGHGKHKD
ncbi:hypothetical protein [Azohydromonas lata]|uniref:Uncharacterized protein n=1 Tax=Azohydromonas lata TaxID=45677 RepID=A0ABU5IJL1_9BURK|nr:hypothetical protein [Azohydromonas lata]MDZ5459080.1 hypothetical protein [Azohydromonas lata]